MKNPFRVLPLLCLLPGLLFQSQAQEAPIAPPSPPFIKRVTLPASWVITFKRPVEDESVDLEALKKFYKETAGPDSESLKELDKQKEPLAKPMVRTLEVTRTTGFTKEAVVFSDKSTQITYIFNVARLTKHIAFDTLIRSRRSENVAYFSPDFSKADFSSFEWLQPEHFKSIQTVMNTKCYFFEAQIPKPTAPNLVNQPPDKEELKVVARALIAVDTGLPLVLQLGQETRIFAFRPPSPDDLILPSEVSVEIKKWKASLISATKPASKP